MSIAYFDASAFVKLVVDEDGSDLAAALWDSCDIVVSSVLSYPEVHAALAAAARSLRIGAREHKVAERAWERYWAATRVVAFSESVMRRAGAVCRDHALRGAYGVHLASALVLKDDPTTDVIMVAWDQRLAVAALQLGFRIAPA